MGLVVKALEQHLSPGIPIHVTVGKWFLYHLTPEGDRFRHRAPDPRMEVSAAIGGGRRGARRFAAAYGLALKAVPGLLSVTPRTLVTSVYSSDWGVEVQVAAVALLIAASW